MEFDIPAIFPSNNNTRIAAFIEPPNNHDIDGTQRKKRANPNEALVLSTAPEDPPTHWQQVSYVHLIYVFSCAWARGVYAAHALTCSLNNIRPV